MRKMFCACLGLSVLAWSVWTVVAQEPSKAAKKVADVAADKNEAAIRAAVEQFVKAYNAHDAKAPGGVVSGRSPGTSHLESVVAEKVRSAEKLVGTWKASSQGAQFQLDIAKNGGFVRTYARGKDKESVTGVFAVDQNNLALEPDTGGTMLAEVDLTNPLQMLFKMIGGDAKDPGLQFKKS